MTQVNSSLLKTRFNDLSTKLANDVGANLTSKDDIANYNRLIQSELSGLSFEDLDKAYETGIPHNRSMLPETVWTLVVGFSMLSRYDLSIEDYIDWAKKQNDATVTLLQLIDNQSDEAKSYVSEAKEKAVKDAENGEKRRREIKYAELKQKLRSLTKVITVLDLKDDDEDDDEDDDDEDDDEDDDDWLSIFDRDIVLSDSAKQLANANKAFKSIRTYSLSILDNEFNNRCSNYKDSISNINGVITDALDAAWVKAKKELKKLGVEENAIAQIKDQFSPAYNISDKITNTLLDLSGQLVDTAQGKAVNISEIDKSLREFNYIGVGAGMLEAIEANIQANFLNSVHQLFTSIITAFSIKYTVNSLEKAANELFCGKETLKTIQSSITQICDILIDICLYTVCEDNIENPIECQNIYNEMLELHDLFDNEDLSVKQQMAIDFFEAFPEKEEPYKYIINNFTNMSCDTFCIQQYFSVEIDGEENIYKVVELASSDKMTIYNHYIRSNLSDGRTAYDIFDGYDIILPRNKSIYSNERTHNSLPFLYQNNGDVLLCDLMDTGVMAYIYDIMNIWSFSARNFPKLKTLLGYVEQVSMANIKIDTSYTPVVIIGTDHIVYKFNQITDDDYEKRVFLYADEDAIIIIYFSSFGKPSITSDYTKVLIDGISVVNNNNSNDVIDSLCNCSKKEALQQLPSLDNYENLIGYYLNDYSDSIKKEYIKNSKAYYKHAFGIVETDGRKKYKDFLSRYAIKDADENAVMLCDDYPFALSTTMLWIIDKYKDPYGIPLNQIKEVLVTTRSWTAYHEVNVFVLLIDDAKIEIELNTSYLYEQRIACDADLLNITLAHIIVPGKKRLFNDESVTSYNNGVNDYSIVNNGHFLRSKFLQNS